MNDYQVLDLSMPKRCRANARQSPTLPTACLDVSAQGFKNAEMANGINVKNNDTEWCNFTQCPQLYVYQLSNKIENTTIDSTDDEQSNKLVSEIQYITRSNDEEKVVEVLAEEKRNAISWDNNLQPNGSALSLPCVYTLLPAASQPHGFFYLLPSSCVLFAEESQVHTNNDFGPTAARVDLAPFSVPATITQTSPSQGQPSRVPSPNFRFFCNFNCGMGFNHRSEKQLHHRIHHNKSKFRCKCCGHKCERKNNMKAHIRRMHFKLPTTRKLQIKQHIADDRDPNLFIEEEVEM